MGTGGGGDGSRMVRPVPRCVPSPGSSRPQVRPVPRFVPSPGASRPQVRPVPRCVPSPGASRPQVRPRTKGFVPSPGSSRPQVRPRTKDIEIRHQVRPYLHLPGYRLLPGSLPDSEDALHPRASGGSVAASTLLSEVARLERAGNWEHEPGSRILRTPDSQRPVDRRLAAGAGLRPSGRSGALCPVSFPRENPRDAAASPVSSPSSVAVCPGSSESWSADPANRGRWSLSAHRRRGTNSGTCHRRSPG
jgi:hypothetical protein